MRRFTLNLLAIVLMQSTVCVAAGQSLAELEQQALRAATNTVADSVVQIRTVGGLDRVGKKLLSTGPTTGLIVSEDGYIVSSAFNFAGQPSSILVRLANGKQLAAKLVARDKNRMLVLLKVAADGALSVPQPAPIDEIQVGQWAVALGRTFQAEEVGVSVGIVSALNRKYGRVLQTDANVSVANYGGPLVNVAGEVMGVLVPMSPQAASGGEENDLAGAEYYDSGIGFAVPLVHILDILERWKTGDDLLSGKLGIGLQDGDAHVTPPKVTAIWPKSPAAVAGWKVDDLVVSVEGHSVATQAQLRFQIMPRYANDSLRVTLKRGDEEIPTEVTLVGKLAPYRHAFLGVLPARTTAKDNPTGAVLRQIWPNSPASKAGLKPSDRITKLNDTAIKTHADARTVLAGLHPDQSVAIEAARGETELKLTATLNTIPADILSAANLVVKNTEANAANNNNESKVEQLKLPEFSQEAVYYSPASTPGRPLGLVLWLGDGNDEHAQSLLDEWQSACQRDGLVLLVAPPEADTWKSSDLAYLSQLVRTAARRWNLDQRRMVAVGQGKAGQLAYALTLKNRSSFSGVVSIDAPLPRTLTPSPITPRQNMSVLAIESRNSNFAPLIRRDINKLREAGYPVSQLQRPETNDPTQGLSPATRESITRWIDGLDRY